MKIMNYSYAVLLMLLLITLAFNVAIAIECISGSKAERSEYLRYGNTDKEPQCNAICGEASYTCNTENHPLSTTNSYPNKKIVQMEFSFDYSYAGRTPTSKSSAQVLINGHDLGPEKDKYLGFDYTSPTCYSCGQYDGAPHPKIIPDRAQMDYFNTTSEYNTFTLKRRNGLGERFCIPAVKIELCTISDEWDEGFIEISNLKMTNLEGVKPEYYAQGETFKTTYIVESKGEEMKNVDIYFAYHEQMSSQSYTITDEITGQDVTSQYTCSEKIKNGKRNIHCIVPIFEKNRKFKFEHRIKPVQTLYGSYENDVIVETLTGYNANKDSKVSISYSVFTSELKEAIQQSNTQFPTWKATGLRKGSKTSDIADVAYLDVPSEYSKGEYILEVLDPKGIYFQYGFTPLALGNRVRFSEDKDYEGYKGKSGLLVPPTFVVGGKRVFLQILQYVKTPIHDITIQLKPLHNVTGTFQSDIIPNGEAQYYRVSSPLDISRFVKIQVTVDENQHRLASYLTTKTLPAFYTDDNAMPAGRSVYNSPYISSYSSVTRTSTKEKEDYFYIMVQSQGSTCNPTCKHRVISKISKPTRIAVGSHRVPLDADGYALVYMDYNPNSMFKMPAAAYFTAYQKANEDNKFSSGSIRIVARAGLLPFKTSSYNEDYYNFTVSSSSPVINYKLSNEVKNFGDQKYWYFRLEGSKSRAPFLEIDFHLVESESKAIDMSKSSSTKYTMKMLDQRLYNMELRSTANGIFFMNIVAYTFQPGVYIQVGDEMATKVKNDFKIDMSPNQNYDATFIFIRNDEKLYPVSMSKHFTKNTRSLPSTSSDDVIIHPLSMKALKTNMISVNLDSTERNCYHGDNMESCLKSNFDVSIATELVSFSEWKDDPLENMYTPTIGLMIFKLNLDEQFKKVNGDGGLNLEITARIEETPIFPFDYIVTAGKDLEELLGDSKKPYVLEKDNTRSVYDVSTSPSHSLAVKKATIPHSDGYGEIYILVKKSSVSTTEVKFSIYTYAEGETPPSVLTGGKPVVSPLIGFIPLIVFASIFACLFLVVCAICTGCFCLICAWRLDVKNKRRFRKQYEKNLKYRKERDEKNKSLLESENSTPFQRLQSSEKAPPIQMDAPPTNYTPPPSNGSSTPPPSSNAPPTPSTDQTSQNDQKQQKPQPPPEPQSFVGYLSGLFGRASHANAGYVQFGNFDSSTGTFSNPTTSFSARTTTNAPAFNSSSNDSIRRMNDQIHSDNMRRNQQQQQDNIRRMNENINRNNQIHRDNITRMNNNIQRQNQAMHQRIHQQNMNRMHNNIHRPPPPPVFRPPM